MKPGRALSKNVGAMPTLTRIPYSQNALKRGFSPSELRKLDCSTKCALCSLSVSIIVCFSLLDPHSAVWRPLWFAWSLWWACDGSSRARRCFCVLWGTHITLDTPILLEEYVRWLYTTDSSFLLARQLQSDPKLKSWKCKVTPLQRQCPFFDN